MLVKDHMATDLVTLHPEMEILRAAQVLISCDISGAPVLDRHGRLAGILTERDCIRVAVHAGYHGEPGGLVRDFMTENPATPFSNWPNASSAPSTAAIQCSTAAGSSA